MYKESRKRNRCLNLLKGVACIGVVLIHIQFPGVTGLVVEKMSRFAVPLFLMIAGFYAYNCDECTAKKRLQKIFKIFVIGYLVYFAWYFGMALLKGEGLEYLSLNYNWKTIVNIVVFCSPNPLPGHLWYLIAMIEVYMLWYFIVKVGREKLFLPLIPLLFLLQVGLTIFCDFKGLFWSYKINFILSGLPYFLMGYYIRSKDSLPRIKNKWLFVTILFCIPMILLSSITDFYINYSCIFLIPYSIAIFLLGVKNPDRSASKFLEYIGEKLSLFVYIFHILISSVYGLLARCLFHVDLESELYQWTKPLLVISFSIFTAFVVNKIQTIVCNRGMKS